MKELNYTSQAEPRFQNFNNILRELCDETLPEDYFFAKIKEELEQFLLERVKELYFINSQIQKEHSLNINSHLSQFSETFHRIMMQDACTIMEQQQVKSLEECIEFSRGIVNEGLSIAIPNHISEMQYLIMLYTNLKNGQKFIVEYGSNVTVRVQSEEANQSARALQSEGNEVFNAEKINNGNSSIYLNILQSKQSFEINEMQNTYLMTLFRCLLDQLMSQLDDQYASENSISLTLLIIFLVMLFIIYLLYWLPVFHSISQDLANTRTMITMIPIIVIRDSKEIRQFLQKFLNLHE